jgi:hypothetical protein
MFVIQQLQDRRCFWGSALDFPEKVPCVSMERQDKGSLLHGSQLQKVILVVWRSLQVVYATAVTKPGHGNMAPLAIGFTLFASAFVGAHHNPQFLQPP